MRTFNVSARQPEQTGLWRKRPIKKGDTHKACHTLEKAKRRKEEWECKRRRRGDRTRAHVIVHSIERFFFFFNVVSAKVF